MVSYPRMLKFPKGQYHPLRLLGKTVLRYLAPHKSGRSSPYALDVVIPVSDKDLPTLPLVVACARQNILNPVNTIYVVGKTGPVEQFCMQEGCVFVNEATILPVTKSDIQYKGKEWPRAGWLFQQLLKLSADLIAKEDNILILDADTCITRPQSFVLADGRMVLNFADEYHFPYGNQQRFLPLDNRFFLSFVCHHMVMRKTILQNLKKEMSTHMGKGWVQGILDKVDMAQSCCFSEYELYGNYLYHNYPGLYVLEYWNNKAIKGKGCKREVITTHGKKYKTISFHSHSSTP